MTLQLIQLLQFVKDDNWEGMLKHFPEGIEHRGVKYRDVEDFELKGSYDEDAKYTYPAREKMKEKCLQYCIEELTNLCKTL